MNRDRAGSFGDDALQYDRSRPRYPVALLNELGSGDPVEVVDVGCGTGVLSRQLAEMGCRVVGVEPDERMAAVARGSGVTVEIATFEEWEAAGRRFDLVTSGQAWHWVRPDEGASKAASVLRPTGRFAAVWNVPSHREATMAAFEPIYARLAPEILEESVALGIVAAPHGKRDADADALVAAGFVNVERREYGWARTYSRDEWLDELPTHSNHRLLPETVLGELLRAVGAAIDRLGGAISTDYTTKALFALKSL